MNHVAVQRMYVYCSRLDILVVLQKTNRSHIAWALRVLLICTAKQSQLMILYHYYYWAPFLCLLIAFYLIS
jgi:hypothetical protein